MTSRLTRVVLVWVLPLLGMSLPQPVCAAAPQKQLISVVPSSVSVEPGAAVQLTAVDATGLTVSASWSSNAIAVARVSSTGLLEAIASGTATVTARYNRGKASRSVRVSSSARSASMPFGPKQLPAGQFGPPPWTGAYVNSGSVSKLQTMLALAQQHGMHLIVKLAPAHDAMLDSTTGCFDIQLWKQAIDKLKPFDFAPYVANGAVIGAELVNEPHASDWCLSEPRRLTKAEVEEMAAYAKAIWPTLPVGAGRSDWVLANAPWTHLDFAHSQYHMRKGDVDKWRDETVKQAQSAGVGHLMSLNYLKGQPDDSPMTAAQVEYYGSALAKDTYSCMLTGYMYDATYDAGPGIADAFRAVAAIAGSHSAHPCYFKSVK